MYKQNDHHGNNYRNVESTDSNDPFYIMFKENKNRVDMVLNNLRKEFNELRIENVVRQQVLEQSKAEMLSKIRKKKEEIPVQDKKLETPSVFRITDSNIKHPKTYDLKPVENFPSLLSNEKSKPSTSEGHCQPTNHRFYPISECMNKISYLKSGNWQGACFAKLHNVDGSGCSLLKYFTEVEPFCAPPAPIKDDRLENLPEAAMQYNLDGLLEILKDPLYLWMRERITRLWPDWVAAAKRFESKGMRWKRKTVIAHMSGISGTGYLLNAYNGGPLGEIVQWSDLLASLYILGYDLKPSLTAEQLMTLLDTNDKNGCVHYPPNKTADIIYTDILGTFYEHSLLKNGAGARNRCKLRLLDSFGTEAEYNVPGYTKKHGIPGSAWGNLNLQLQQFLTLFPHSPDNRFLGFVVGGGSNLKPISTNKTIALLYGKWASYFGYQTIRKYLDVIHEYFEIHATAVTNSKDIPDYVINHGPVSGAEVTSLLEKSKIFIGVGFPYEGPGPIEALAAGAVFLQPKFPIPRNRLNTHFFNGKPTLRKLTSQSPYMEEFIGEPYCFTIDIKNETLLRKTLQKIKEMQPLPTRIPKEFTNEGMLERVHVFTEHMDVCNTDAPRWPPLENLEVILSGDGQSCKDACRSNEMVCEGVYFDVINNEDQIKRYNITCSSTKYVEETTHPPSIDLLTKVCYLQMNFQLFSCVSEDKNVQRLCPCRQYEKEQVTLCKKCLKK